VKKTRQDRGLAVDLVIFDCDGVLVDSEVISCRAHAETLTRHGYPITADQVLQRFLGVSDREARQIIETEMGRRLPDESRLRSSRQRSNPTPAISRRLPMSVTPSPRS